MYEDKHNLLYAFIGIAGGFTKYLLQMPTEHYLQRLAEAGVTALTCGVLGAAGKHIYDLLFKHKIIKMVSINNSGKPAPKWFRKFKKIWTNTENASIVILLAMGYADSSLIICLIKVGTSWLLENLETVLSDETENNEKAIS